MGRHGYEWAEGALPPPIGDHSVAKHSVLHTYLREYISILTSDPRIDHLRVLLVDGFAGGGVYRRERTGELHEGSPLVLLRTMDEAKVAAQATRTKAFRLDADFVFVEEKASVVGFLRRALADRGVAPEQDKRVKVIHGTFDANLDAILAMARSARGGKRRAIFLLDQYGYSAVTMESLRTIFAQMPNAEVILNFAVDFMLDYLADDPRTRAMLARVGLSFDVAETRALLATDPLLGYARVQRNLHRLIFEQSGAGFYTPFYIKPQGSNRAYWLLHLSGHARARDAMASVHWAMPNTFLHFGGSGLEMFGYRPGEDLNLTGQESFGFGKEDQARTIGSLQRDISRRLYSRRDGETFGDLFAQTCNGTPGTRKLMERAIHGLVEQDELLIKTDEGRFRREGVRLRDEDLITPPTQVNLFARKPT